MPTALIIVDVQNDFCEGGALAVGGANAIIPVINRMRDTLKPSRVVLTQDWHPVNHTSFIQNNPGETLFQERSDGQMMWPAHCVQETRGAEFHPALQHEHTDIVIRKGRRPTVDSYSGYGSQPRADGSRAEQTDLEAILDACGIESVVIVGLAFDYCVAATAKDAAAAGFNTTIVMEATRAVNPANNSVLQEELRALGVKIVETVAEV